MGRKTVATRHGFRMELDLGDWVDRHIYALGDYESTTSQLFRALLRPGQTVLDVGANIGYFTLLAARCVGPAGRVLAFEPVPAIRARLIRNVNMNGAGCVDVRAEALADKEGTERLFVGPREHSGISALRPLSSSSGCETVHVMRLDDMLRPDQPVNLVKIDVEGAESRVLRGMDRILDRWRPDLVVEVTDEYLRQFGDSAEALCCGMLDRGYRMHEARWDGLVPIPAWRDGLPEQFNALFTMKPELPPHLTTDD
jgi:FkbM family methyltransferase